MLESEGRDGVSTTAWSNLIKYKWYNIYDKLIWRGLHADKKQNNFFSKLEEFLKLTVGQKYNLSVKKLVGMEKNTLDEDLKSRGYFCSE